MVDILIDELVDDIKPVKEIIAKISSYLKKLIEEINSSGNRTINVRETNIFGNYED